MSAIYVETSIIGYMTARPIADVVFQARQEITRRWWQLRREAFDVYISQLVLDEAGAGDPAAAADRLRLLNGLPLLGESPEADRLADLLLARHLLPAKAAADAQHIALAAVAGVDYLLTWNCKHIANADVLPALYETLRAEGLLPPLIVTPEEFSDAG
jgi:predicted nucleic acid-binding protein